MALLNAKQSVKREGFYVATRRDTGLPWLLSAEHYMTYGEEFERGTFYRTFKEAAKAEEEARLGDQFDPSVNVEEDTTKNEVKTNKVKETK